LKIIQPKAGILNATEAVRMYLKLAKENGCELREKEKVFEILRVSKNRITVRTSKNTYHPKKIVLCCGNFENLNLL
jgi:glycine/D-amino acid oxidase-like deaminating enzyme